MFIAFWTGYSVFFVPYTAWGAELTDNYEERTELRGIVYIFYSIGSAFGTALPPIIVDLLMQWGARVETGWLSVGIFVGVISAAAIFITGWTVHDSEHMAAADRADNADSADNEELAGSAENSASGGKGRFKGLSAAADILRNYGQVLRFKPARLIVLTSVFYLISNSIMMADRMYFFTYNMELTAKEVSLIMLVMQIVSVLLVPPLIRINRVLDKRTLCIGGIGMSAACLTIYGFIGVSSVPHLLLLFFIYGIGSICYWQLIPSMLYDVCDADKLANGTDRAGLIISMQGLSESVFEAVGFQILGILLHLTGFQTDAARQSLETMQCIHVSFTFIPAFFALLALLMMVRYPITRAKHAEIIKNLQQK
jgi:GPH family glycoside/pentoside/hexuronide:cation symporter